MKLTFLGTGTSQGVPVIGCRCKVCTSADPRDNRLRTSAMVETRGVRIVIDAGPDFRYQMLRTGVRHLDAILLTHEHKDHIGGLDDVRAFNFVDYPPTVHKVHIYAAPRALECVRKDFDYAFAQDKYRGVPEIELHEIDTARPFRVGDVEIVPVSGHHSERFEVTGFRIGPLAYLTDFKTIEDAEAEKLRGVEVLAVNALRFAPHPSHFNLAEALALIRRVGPREAYITHMSHEIGLHAATDATLPPGVHLAYDMLEIEIKEKQNGEQKLPNEDLLSEKLLRPMVQLSYAAAMDLVQARLRLINADLTEQCHRQVIRNMSCRIKTLDSVTKKLKKKGREVSFEEAVQTLNDIAGIRVVCFFCDDIYRIADAIKKQKDFHIIKEKDYVKNPKKSGYQSIHVIAGVPVTYNDTVTEIRVEIQIRSFAMDYWAELDTQMCYKKDAGQIANVERETRGYSDVIAKVDNKMLELRQQIEMM